MKRVFNQDPAIFRPLVTVLSFSGGTGSGCLLEMVLRGDLPRPTPFIVVNADPGMENRSTYAYVAHMEVRCKAADIPFIRVKRDLYAELLVLKNTSATRFDTPPLWTRNRKTGKKGRLLQKCTGAYKIAPMDRAVRLWMAEHLGISAKSKRLGINTVCKWIGFSADEWMRIKEAGPKYQYFDYPLVAARMAKQDVLAYLARVGAWIPPRSVCNACFANDVGTFADMYRNRPEDWAQAVAVDNAIRDLSQIGVTDECFVSSTLLGLEELARMNFVVSSEESDAACHSGHCFV